MWSAVRRAVWAEVEAGRRGQRDAVTGVRTELSLDWLIDKGWQPERPTGSVHDPGGPMTSRLVGALVAAGWDAVEVADAIAVMADHARTLGDGRAATKWRWAASRIGIPQWRARRLATLLLGQGVTPGVIELAADGGPGILSDLDVQAALRSTTCRWSAGPAAWLAARHRVPADRANA